jgi:hypothetical protein
MYRKCAYFLSQFCWILIILFFGLIGIVVPLSQSVDPISSASIPWDSSSDPLILSHLSDSHVTHQKKDSGALFVRALQESLRYGANPIVTTGDLADNWEGVFSELGFGDQVEQDFKIYNDSVSILPPNVAYLDLAGNHDEYGVPSLDSDHHYILKYSRSMLNQTTFANLWASTFSVGNFSFVTLNPFVYPRPHAKLGFWIKPTREMLDRIESELLRTPNRFRFILSHFPIRCWFSDAKSTSGKSIRDIIAKSGAVMVLTGHLHPSRANVQHFGGVIEFVGTDLVWHETFGLISIDNGRAAYHQIELDDPPTAILTFPVPKSQLSEAVDFQTSETAIRVISFRNESVEIRVSGAVSGTLTRERQLSRGWLYTFPLDLPDGDHHLSFRGDWTHEVDFVLGNSAKLDREKIYGYPNFVYAGIIGGFVGWLVELVIVFPFFDPAITAAVESWIRGENEEPHWVFVIFLGFLSVRHRIRMLPIWLRIGFIVLVVWPLVLPTAGIAIGKYHGIVWAYGFAINGSNFYDPWATLFNSFYAVLIVLPFLLLGSGLAMTPLFGFDVFIACVGCVMMVVGAVVLIYQAVGTVATIFSPEFVLLPLAMVIGLVVWARRRPKSPADDESTSCVDIAAHTMYIP